MDPELSRVADALQHANQDFFDILAANIWRACADQPGLQFDLTSSAKNYLSSFCATLVADLRIGQGKSEASASAVEKSDNAASAEENEPEEEAEDAEKAD